MTLLKLTVITTIFFGSLATVSLGEESKKSSALPSLIKEALEHSPEILEVEKQHEASLNRTSQSYAPFFPELGVEGGWETYNSASQNLSDSFGYAYGRYNLYRGGKDRYTLLSRNKEEEFISKLLEKTKNRITREVSTQFYELLYLQEALKIKDEALNLNATEIQMAQRRERGGITSKADVLEFTLRDATLKSDISLLKQGRATVLRELNRVLGQDEIQDIIVEGVIGHEHLTKNVSDLLKQALQERIDLKEAQKNKDVASLELSGLRSDSLPRVDFEATYGTLARRDRILDQTPAGSALVKVTIPLFSGLDTYYGTRAKAQDIGALEARGHRITQGIKVQIEDTYARLKAIEDRLDLEEENTERAKQYYTITLGEYKRGVKNSPDLAGAAERLFDSKLRNLQFRRDFYLARISLAEAVGIDEIK